MRIKKEYLKYNVANYQSIYYNEIKLTTIRITVFSTFVLMKIIKLYRITTFHISLCSYFNHLATFILLIYIILILYFIYK